MSQGLFSLRYLLSLIILSTLFGCASDPYEPDDSPPPEKYDNTAYDGESMILLTGYYPYEEEQEGQQYISFGADIENWLLTQLDEQKQSSSSVLVTVEALHGQSLFGCMAMDTNAAASVYAEVACAVGEGAFVNTFGEPDLFGVDLGNIASEESGGRDREWYYEGRPYSEIVEEAKRKDGYSKKMDAIYKKHLNGASDNEVGKEIVELADQMAADAEATNDQELGEKAEELKAVGKEMSNRSAEDSAEMDEEDMAFFDPERLRFWSGSLDGDAAEAKQEKSNAEQAKKECTEGSNSRCNYGNWWYKRDDNQEQPNPEGTDLAGLDECEDEILGNLPEPPSDTDPSPIGSNPATWMACFPSADLINLIMQCTLDMESTPTQEGGSLCENMEAEELNIPLMLMPTRNDLVIDPVPFDFKEWDNALLKTTVENHQLYQQEMEMLEEVAE